MSQSVVGFKVDEPLAPGLHFISQNELAFDPYSGLLANAPQALQNSIGVPVNQQLYPVDLSRWGWLAGQNFAGLSSPVYGTLTFGRQNALETDGVIAYDPMGGSVRLLADRLFWDDLWRRRYRTLPMDHGVEIS